MKILKKPLLSPQKNKLQQKGKFANFQSLTSRMNTSVKKTFNTKLLTTKLPIVV